MSEHRVQWKLKNGEQRSVARYVKRLGKLLCRVCPDEFIIQTVDCQFKAGKQQHFDVNRRLDKERLKEIRRYLKANEDQLDSFLIRFINYSQRDNIQVQLFGEAPYETLTLCGVNLPDWLHALMNKQFHDEIGFGQKLWSYFYSNRLFKYTLNRDVR
ncbi:MAG: hypothetical protein P8X89_14845 [Reinekea sp.]